MKKSRWLVTGGAGFIGSHITERLLKEGHYVRVLDNFSSGKESNLAFTKANIPSTPKGERVRSLIPSTPKGERVRVRGHKGEGVRFSNFDLIRDDIRDRAACETACKGIDYVLHQAALRSVPKSMEIPHEFNAVNIDGSLNILEAALKQKVKRVVMASSSSVYGDAKSFPEKETDMPLLISPYALSKLAAEYYCRVFSQAYGLETVNLRYFNVFGPRQAVDDEYAVVIPKFITCMLRGENPPIHGDGKQSRDFTYIDNVVEANILAATVAAPVIASEAKQSQSNKNVFCEVFNVALGKDNTILELVAILNKIMNKNIKPIHTPPRAGDVYRTNADTTKIKKLLNYKPKVDFESGLNKTVDWFSNQVRRCEASST